MSNLGLRIETAASVIMRDTIQKHMRTFAHVIKGDRAAGQSVVSTYIDGLSGAAALVIVGRHGSREDVIEATVKQLRECIDRDLRLLAGR